MTIATETTTTTTIVTTPEVIIGSTAISSTNTNNNTNNNQKNGVTNSIPPVVAEFLGGTMGGLTGVIFGHPADTVRVRLQNDTTRGYRGFWHCAQETIVKERFRALYKGLLPPLVGETMNNCVLFGVYGFLKPWQEKYASKRIASDGTSYEQNEDYSMFKELSIIAASGAIAGLSISVIVCPTELVKIQFQNNKNHHSSSAVSAVSATAATTAGSSRKESILQCVLRCQRERGSIMAGTFHGFCSTIWREIAFGGSYFLSYECCKRIMAHYQYGDSTETDKLGILSLLLSGGMGGTCAWAIAYPTDYVKSRVQADTSLNTRMVLREIFASNNQGGFKSAYRGFVPTIMRAFPVNAVTFLAYEYVVGLLKR